MNAHLVIAGSGEQIRALVFGPPRSQGERDRAEIRGCLRRFRQYRAMSLAWGETATKGCVKARVERLRVRELVRHIRAAEG